MNIPARIPNFTIFTDGSCLPKSGRGAWAFVLYSDQTVPIERSGANKKTTSNRMEFQAAIEALKMLPHSAVATLYTDSRNLTDTMTIWLPRFQAANWKKKSGRPIPDADLIQELAALVTGKTMTWKWVKSHAGNSSNERCDELCDEALRTAA